MIKSRLNNNSCHRLHRHDPVQPPPPITSIVVIIICHHQHGWGFQLFFQKCKVILWFKKAVRWRPFRRPIGEDRFERPATNSVDPSGTSDLKTTIPHDNLKKLPKTGAISVTSFHDRLLRHFFNGTANDPQCGESLLWRYLKAMKFCESLLVTTF